MNDVTINADVTLSEGGQALLANRYRVVKPLGQGGMGSVWLAEDTKLDGHRVAIKMLPSILVSNKRAYRQIKSEALVSLRLSHPNIATLRSFEEDNGNPFLVVDYIDGQTLDDYIADNGAMLESDVCSLLMPVAEALDYAHRERVVHRDVKPANIMIRKDGTPFVLDFGIAREMQETMTRVTGRLSSGTLMYMSPEQLKGAAPSAEQDVYSFAALLYECLTEHPPFYRGQIEYQIETQRPEPLDPSIRFGAAIMAGLEKDPALRPASCRALLSGGQIESRCDIIRPYEEGRKLEALKTQILDKQRKAAELYSQVGPMRSDPQGLTNSLSVIDAQYEITRDIVLPDSIDAAEEVLSAVSSAVGVIEDSVRWVVRNVALRDDCRRYSSAVVASHQNAIDDYKRELSSIPDYAHGNKARSDAIRLFEQGEFSSSKGMWSRVDSFYNDALSAAKLLREKMLCEQELCDVRKKVALERSRGAALLTRIDAFRADPEGVEKSLASATEKWISIRQYRAPKDLQAAEEVLRITKLTVDEIQRMADFIESQVALRDNCRQCSSTVLARYESQIKEYAEEFAGLSEYAQATAAWRNAVELYGCGDYAKSKVAWKEMDEACAVALSKAIASRKANRRVFDLGDGITMEFAYCPPGSFMMGSPPDEQERNPDEIHHLVKFSKGFWMGVSPVTKAQWRAVMGGLAKVHMLDGDHGFSDDDHPKSLVSWYDCQQYIKALNLRFDVVSDLPTEAEWEYACRAGTETPYNFGSELNGDKANCNGRYPYGTNCLGQYKAVKTKVGLYGSNPWGLVDFHGNVSEWCSDWYGQFTSSEVADPKGPKDGKLKVLRGGNWLQKAKDCRSASRSKQKPSARTPPNGFRLVLRLV